MQPADYAPLIEQATAIVAAQEPPMVDMIGEETQKLAGISNEDASSNPILFGLMYMDAPKELEDTRDKYGFLAPKYEFPDGVFPKPVAATSEEEYQQWKDIAAVVQSPWAKARYSDLLVQRLPSGNERFEYAKSAINSYREFAASDWSSGLDRKDAITRALELAQLFKQQPIIDEIVQSMVSMAEENLESEEPYPGVSLPLLESAAEVGSSSTEEILALNDKAIEMFKDNGFAIDTAHHIQELLVPQDKRDDLYRQQAEFLYSEAMAFEDGFNKLYQLHQVEAFAELHGLKDISSRAISATEAIPLDSLNMKQSTVEFQITDKQLAAFTDAVVGDDSLALALHRLGATKAMSSYEDNKKLAEQLATNHPMLMLFRSYNMGEANSVITSAASEEEKLEGAISDNERLDIIGFSPYAIAAFKKIVEKYHPSVDDFAAALESEMIDIDEARAAARGFMHLVNSDADSSVKCLAPLIERLIRGAARKSGVPTTKLPNSSRHQPGGVRGLGEILASMQGFMTNEDLRRYWRNALVEVEGHNLRNKSGHGLVVDFGEPDAAILVHIICTIFNLTIQQKPKQ